MLRLKLGGKTLSGLLLFLKQLSSTILWDTLIKNLPDVHKTQSTYIR